MKHYKNIARSCVAAALLALTSAAPPPGEFHLPQPYLTPATTIDAVALIGPPPAPGSPREAADRARFDETRALEGTVDWARAQAIDELRKPGIALHSFSCAAGVTLSHETTPRAIDLFYKVLSDARLTYRVSKDKYQRPRPFIGNDKPICVSREGFLKGDPSYPSGHSELGYAWGLLLAEALPDRASPLVVAGRQFGDDRVICGVHFQSDVDAGRVLAGALVARLHADPAFQRDYAAVIAELRAARTRGPAPQC